MSAPAELRRGWCPSLLRPMPSGDGLLARIAIPGGIVSAELLRGVASGARRFGNGFVDLTQRGNLQIRGVSEATLPALIDALAGLGLTDPAGETGASRDILASPLAGIDPSAVCDIRPIVAALRERLACDEALRALPAKFCLTVDDGGRLGLDDVRADIRFTALRGSVGPAFAVTLGGAAHDAVACGVCAAADLAEVAAALAHAFLGLRQESEVLPGRMRDLVRRPDAAALLRATLAPIPGTAGVPPALETADLACASERKGDRDGRGPSASIGFHRLDAATGYLGIGATFGRLTADQLDVVAEGVEEVGAEIRLTPWRALLIAGIDAGTATWLRARFARHGLIATARDPRLAVAACPGRPACARSTVATREDALVLAPLARQLACAGIGLHLSGCLKGCARGEATRVILVGREGRYDLVLDGRAGDAPSRAGLSLEAAKAALAQLVSAEAAQAATRPHGRMG
ncbi:precorrin-3B synthase [Rhizobiales bacterium GAS191]|nr:precorrin-3B synthase [Rhizobiales bacterium GAS191]SED18175.1 precorrin-3B synthase [Rhizobiales bacterium GAS188]